MVDKELPLVSVCIPSYNHAQYLKETIESVLSQTYSNIEMVIVDDGSTDNSLAIATQYAETYPDKVRVYTHPDKQNHGISGTVNYAFNLSKGTYWSGLPSDDLLLPEKIEKQVKYLESHPELGFVYGYAAGINNQGEPLVGEWEQVGRDITQEPNPILTLLEGNCIFGMTVLARREVIEKTGDHRENLVCSDWEFWVRLLLLAKAGFMAETQVKYRVHEYNTSLSAPYATQLKWIFEVLRSLRLKAAQDPKLSLLNSEPYLSHLDLQIEKCLGAILDDQATQRETLRNQLEQSNQQFAQSNLTIQQLKASATEKEQALLSITDSRGWALLQLLWRIRRWIAPNFRK